MDDNEDDAPVGTDLLRGQVFVRTRDVCYLFDFDLRRVMTVAAQLEEPPSGSGELPSAHLPRNRTMRRFLRLHRIAVGSRVEFDVEHAGAPGETYAHRSITSVVSMQPVIVEREKTNAGSAQ